MAEDKPLKKPFTDEQKDLLMDYLFNKFMEDMMKDKMRREDFYNQPPETDPEGKRILSANMGGMISIDQLTSPLMMSSGGDANLKILEKIGRVGKDTTKLKVPTIRLNDNFRNILLESGFDKKATAKDVKAGYATKTGQKIGSFTAFNNYLGKINPNLTIFSNDPRTMVKVTNELNKVRGNLGLPKYTNVGITTPRSKFEQIQTGTQYGEAGSKIPKEKVQKVTLEAQLKADKQFGVTPKGKPPTKKKLNFMAKYIQSKLGKTLTLTSIMSFLTKSGFGKTIPGLDLFIPSPMGSGELPEKGTPEYEQLMKDMGKNQGGMMDINFMTRPMGYKDGTRDGTLVGDKKEEIPVREIVRDEPEGIMGTLKSILSKKEFGTIENPLPLDRVFDPGVSQKTLIDEGAFITTPDGITFKATPFMFDKYLGTKYVENNTFGQRDDVEVEFRPKYITSAEKSFVEPGGVFDQVQTPRKEGRFTEMNQGGIMDINQLTKRIR